MNILDSFAWLGLFDKKRPSGNGVVWEEVKRSRRNYGPKGINGNAL